MVAAFAGSGGGALASVGGACAGLGAICAVSAVHCTGGGAADGGCAGDGDVSGGGGGVFAGLWAGWDAGWDLPGADVELAAELLRDAVFPGAGGPTAEALRSGAAGLFRLAGVEGDLAGADHAGCPADGAESLAGAGRAADPTVFDRLDGGGNLDRAGLPDGGAFLRDWRVGISTAWSGAGGGGGAGGKPAA